MTRILYCCYDSKTRTKQRWKKNEKNYRRNWWVSRRMKKSARSGSKKPGKIHLDLYMMWRVKTMDLSSLKYCCFTHAHTRIGIYTCIIYVYMYTLEYFACNLQKKNNLPGKLFMSSKKSCNGFNSVFGFSVACLQIFRELPFGETWILPRAMLLYV